MQQEEIAKYLEEVTSALFAIGDERYGRAIQLDRGSELPHLGITFPALRARVKAGFSFYGRPAEQVLAVWDALWRTSSDADVLYAALDYYRWKGAKVLDPGVWEVTRHWSARIDNWCHADLLAGLYSQLLERFHDDVYPQLVEWNAVQSEWLRRLWLVSLVHYSGKNAVFVPPEDVWPLLANCVDDHRKSVATAVGWVLREMDRGYPAEVTAFLEANASRLSAAALTRATERRSHGERARLRALRKAGAAKR